MSGILSARAGALAVLAAAMSLLVASPVQAGHLEFAAASTVVAAIEGGAEPITIARQSDDDVVDPDQAKSGRPIQPLIGIGVMSLILVFGLRAIKRQRDEGRRSKLPPIG